MRAGANTSRFESLSATPFYIGLGLSGLATTLLGPILPVLSARWGLNDAQGGSFFAVQFMASTLGSVLSSYFPGRSVMLGFAAIAAGMAALAWGNYGAAYAAFALIGLGYGAAVSATNLIFGTEYPARRSELLTRVNLCWGAGAVLSSELAALAVRANALRTFLLLLALFAFVLFTLFLPLAGRGSRHAAEGPAPRPAGRAFGLPVFVLFSVVLFLYVGAETAVAGWVATYVHRMASMSTARADLFVSAFWLSVVAGRGGVVLLLRVVSERAVLTGGLAVAAAGVAAFLFLRSPQAAIGAVLVAGVGFAPLFPLLVARMLTRTGRSRHTGWIFAICGSGGAVVPWITGVVSQYSGGLRAAFLVPLAALGGIAICVLAESAMAPAGNSFVQN